MKKLVGLGIQRQSPVIRKRTIVGISKFELEGDVGFGFGLEYANDSASCFGLSSGSLAKA